MSSIRLVAQTREIPPVDDLLAHTSAANPLAWLRRGDGIVAAGDGIAASIRIRGGQDRTREQRMADAWRELAQDAEIDDPVALPGTGLVAFGALTFDEDSKADSVLVVPQAVIGRRDGRSWITRIRTLDDADFAPVSEPAALAPHWAGRVGPGAQTPQGYQDAVRAALGEITAGAYEKVVLARDLTGTVPSDADLRRLVGALSTDYPDTWTFAVDGLVGASPETLVTTHARTVTARVLAGTTARGADPVADATASAALAASAKDLDEHGFAVQSVLATLRPHTRALEVDGPFVLELPNLFHLATDVRGDLADGDSALDLVGAMHPTAAVAGTPTDAAIAAIRRLEPFDRGRYAGPVGWIDASGDGEWAIALRCAQFADAPSDASRARQVTAYAGAGIVAGSDPEAELLETRVKFRPLVDALA
ncbi:isochorismate synthase MenF [uncultured Microbacterium sp.]|uniref:isochorismate synthase n=1 Tax=uncultured Microbacterium sp. TaxID=191216 RepID=UPI00262011A8|nr:isochorismate synthase [uncultured Microbacterium sp.]